MMREFLKFVLKCSKRGWWWTRGTTSSSKFLSTSLRKLTRSGAKRVWWRTLSSALGSTSHAMHTVLAMMDAVRFPCTPSTTSSPKVQPWSKALSLVMTRAMPTSDVSSNCSLTRVALPQARTHMELAFAPCSMIRSPGVRMLRLPCRTTSSRHCGETEAKRGRLRRSLLIFSSTYVSGRALRQPVRSGRQASRSAGISSRAFAMTWPCRMLTQQTSSATTLPLQSSSALT
mmetsp:Transcript_6849/g.20161  ORF Transcript_6849/g.20161 Transcript_6849/m.20161 type:complete len:230 (+) Transcript_6849:840-1529(+)